LARRRDESNANPPKPKVDPVPPGAAELRVSETARVGDSLQWITARLPPDLVREIDAHAKRMGATRSDAIRDCLGIGMETIRSREGVPAGRAEELLGALEGVRLTLDLMGPPTFGMLRLLAHWAARDGSVKVSEDELLAEVRVTGADEWEQAVADAERDLADKANSLPMDSH
jgi:hypothetical protein